MAPAERETVQEQQQVRQQQQAQAVQELRTRAFPASRHFERPVEPSSRVARPKCPACQGEEAQKQQVAGTEICPVCGRYLGQGRERSFSR
jgi:ribosomal protein S27E